jgi:hypothetical protein
MKIKLKLKMKVYLFPIKSSKIKNQFSKIRMLATFGKGDNLKLSKGGMQRKTY